MNSRIKVPTCTFVHSTLTSLIQLIIKFSFKNRCNIGMLINITDIFFHIYFSIDTYFFLRKKSILYTYGKKNLI